MNDLISVIVPVYNVEKYLRECLDSVVSQTYSNLEILLVDDGSTDASGVICDEYTRMDNRIHVIHQKNRGLSAARNAGLDVARGRYISFIDSDDLVGKHFLEVLYRALIENKAQISACGYYRFQDGQPSGDECCSRRCTVWSRKEAILELTKISDNRRGEFVAVSWNKLYDRTLFQELRFPVGKIHEDEYVILPLLLQIERMVKCEDVLHFYRQRDNSITGVKQQKDVRRVAVIDAYRDRCVLLKTPEYEDIYSDVVTSYFEMMAYKACTDGIQTGQLWAVYRRYWRELIRYGRWIRARRLFLFAACPYLYWLRHVEH